MSSSDTPAQGAEMCPPVTLEVLFPPPPPPPSTTPPTVPGPADATTTPPTVTTTTAPAETTTTAPPPPCEPFIHDLYWPLAGKGQIMSGFGADRDHGQRHHQGNDISAPKLTPVVAVADGVVIQVVQEAGTEDCCWAGIQHADGWQSFYLHLNNDRHGTDDGLGVGVRTDLAEGAEVKGGEVIGWVGDSGNAEDTIEHLYFELRNPDGAAVDPGPSLSIAQREAELLDPQPNWPFADDDGLDSEWVATAMLSEGLFLPCDETLTTFCPDRIASPDVAGDIVRYFAGKEPPALEGEYQVLPTPLGCRLIDECLGFGLPESEIARLAVWARIDRLEATLLPEDLNLEGAPVVSLPSAEEAEARLRADGARQACNPPLDNRGLLSRAETLVRLVAWIRGLNPEPCSEPGQPAR